MDTGTTQITPKGPRIRTFQDCAYRRYSWLWTRGIQWRLPHVIGRNATMPGLNDALPNKTSGGDVRALEPGEEKPTGGLREPGRLKDNGGGRRKGGNSSSSSLSPSSASASFAKRVSDIGADTRKKRGSTILI